MIRPTQPRRQFSPDFNRAAIVKVSARERDVSHSVGSGCLIASQGNNGLVLTAAHVVSRGPATVAWPTGGTSAAEVIASEQSGDVSILYVQNIPAVAPIPVDCTDDHQGRRVVLAGYPGGGAFRLHTGRVTDLASYQGMQSRELIEVDSQAMQGESGGPIVANGKVIGVISTAGRGETYGPCALRIRRLLDRLTPRLAWARPGCYEPGYPRIDRTTLPPQGPQPHASQPPPDRLAELAKYLKQQAAELAVIQDKLASLGSTPGPPGPPGPQGPPGPSGVAGPSGASSAPPGNAPADSRLDAVLARLEAIEGRLGEQATPQAVDVDALAAALNKKIGGSIRVTAERVKR